MYGHYIYLLNSAAANKRMGITIVEHAWTKRQQADNALAVTKSGSRPSNANGPTKLFQTCPNGGMATHSFLKKT